MRGIVWEGGAVYCVLAFVGSGIAEVLGWVGIPWPWWVLPAVGMAQWIRVRTRDPWEPDEPMRIPPPRPRR